MLENAKMYSLKDKLRDEEKERQAKEAVRVAAEKEKKKVGFTNKIKKQK